MSRIRHALQSELQELDDSKRDKKESKHSKHKKHGKKEKSRSKRSRSRTRSRSGSWNRRRDESSYHSRRKRSTSNSPDSNKSKMYGLIKNTTESNNTRSGERSLGPSQSLLSQKREEEKAARDAALKYRNRPKSTTNSMSEEEKQRRLNAMQSDAHVHEEHRFNRNSQNNSTFVRDDDEENGEKGQFLNKMRSQIYVTNTTNVESQLSRNKYYYQKGEDLDSAGFMKR